MDIVDKINILIGERKLSGKASSDKKSYERKHYRMGKHKKKASLKKLRRSAEGDKREKRTDRLAKSGITPTGKKKVRYHV
jgi:hypothetical protein